MVVRNGGGRLGWAAALAVVAALFAPTAAAESGEVAVGGYLDLFPGGGAGRGIALALNPDTQPSLGTSLGRLAVTDTGPRTTLTYFTPRLSGFELGLGYTPRADADQQPAAAVGHVPGDAGAEDGLAVGGGLRLGALGLGLPAAHAQGGGLGDGSAGLVTAGVGYGFGPINTNVTYGFTTSTVDREIDLLAVSADMAVVPGIAVTGGVAVSAEEETGDRAAAGMVGIRLNF